MIGQVWRRLQLLFAQGSVTLADADSVQVKVLNGETLKARRVEPSGLSYRPKAGAQAYLVFPAGDRAQGLALLIGDKRYQLELGEGDVALHNANGSFVKVTDAGDVFIKSATAVHIDAPELLHNGVNVGATHRHGLVRAGTDNSGPPA